AQAVLAVALAWWDAGSAQSPRELPLGRGAPASKAELTAFFARLEAELDACGFLRNPEMRPTMVNNLRSIFHRAGLLAHEVRTLRGGIAGLTRRPHAPREDAPPQQPGLPGAKAGRPRRAARGRAG